MATASQDPQEIIKAKEGLVEHYEDLKAVGLITEEQLKFKLEKIDASIFRNRIQETVANEVSKRDEIGETEFVELLQTMRKHPLYKQIDLKTQEQFDRMYKNSVEIDKSSELKSYTSNFDSSIKTTLRGFSSIEDFRRVSDRYFARALKVLPTLKGEKRKNLKLEMEQAKFYVVGMEQLAGDPSLLMNSNPEVFISQVLGEKIEDLDRSSGDYLKAMNMYSEFQGVFGGLDSVAEIKSFYEGIGSSIENKNKFSPIEESRKEAVTAVKNASSNFSEELKKVPGFEKAFVEFPEKVIAYAKGAEQRLGEMKVEPEDAERILAQFQGLLKRGLYDDAISMVNMYTDQGVNIFSNLLEGETNFTSKNLKSHFSVLGQLHIGTSQQVNRNFTNGYLGVSQSSGG